MLSDIVPRWPGAELEPHGRLAVATQLLPTGILQTQVTGEVDRDNAVQLRDALLRAVRRASGRGRITWI